VEQWPLRGKCQVNRNVPLSESAPHGAPSGATSFAVPHPSDSGELSMWRWVGASKPPPTPPPTPRDQSDPCCAVIQRRHSYPGVSISFLPFGAWTSPCLHSVSPVESTFSPPMGKVVPSIYRTAACFFGCKRPIQDSFSRIYAISRLPYRTRVFR
jgi:hypothetical protein